ncbi:hypothetical protein G6L37_01935 [Agrobacterium rubi]|nr:hypothetical protein [Agrobacterium rubi]NTF24153.1 hypothetical protein [Agrobacterium rubi]
MRKLITKIRDIPYALAAAATVALATDAHAAKTVGEAAKGMFDQTSAVGKFLLAAFALGGVTMFATGFFKLKQASENPQTKYSEGAWRIAVGAGLCAIPAVAAMMAGSIGLGDVGTMSVQGGAAF